MTEAKNPFVEFLKSPHFTVIGVGMLTVLAGVGMYGKLDTKIDALRLETKADLQVMTQHSDVRFDKTDARFDKVDAKFDKVDDRFEAVMKKLDDTQAAIRDIQKHG